MKPANITREQFNTLKDFDFELFKKGTKIVNEWGAAASYISENTNEIVVSVNNRGVDTFIVLRKSELGDYQFKMLPLGFVEGKPVYPGDLLYCKAFQEGWIASVQEWEEGDEKYLTWNKTKKMLKKEAWVNLYHRAAYCNGAELGQLHPSEDIALMSAKGVAYYIKTIHIEWEEPAKLEEQEE